MGAKTSAQADTFPGQKHVYIFLKISRPTFSFVQLAVQSLDVFAIPLNTLLEGVLFLAMKSHPAPLKLGSIGPTEERFPQSCREESLGEKEVAPDFWPEVVLFSERKGKRLVPWPPHHSMVVACLESGSLLRSLVSVSL